MPKWVRRTNSEADWWSSVGIFTKEDVDISEAEGWVKEWSAVSRIDELEIPLKLVSAALRWMGDRDRAHLLELPAEQREVLMNLLDRDD